MPAIFLDTSALVPMVMMRDEQRPSLLRVMEGLRRAGKPSFVTSNWSLYEALGLCRQSSHDLAQSLYIETGTQIAVMPVSRRAEADALQRFLRWHDESASVTDHANLLVALEARCEAAISFDPDFQPIVRSAGLRLLS